MVVTVVVTVVVFLRVAIVLGIRRAHRAMQLPVAAHVGLVVPVAVRSQGR